MAATALNILVEQGATWTQDVALGENVSGHAFRAEIRDTWRREGGWLVAEIQVSVTDAATGAVRLSLDAATTAQLRPLPQYRDGKQVATMGAWDLISTTPDGAVRRWRYGLAYLSQGITE